MRAAVTPCPPTPPSLLPRSAFRGGSLGAGATFVGCPGGGLQSVEEVADRALGTEHVTSRVLPVLRDDGAFALGLRPAHLPDPEGQAPLIAQPHPPGVVAPFRQLGRHAEPAQQTHALS